MKKNCRNCKAFNWETEHCDAGFEVIIKKNPDGPRSYLGSVCRKKERGEKTNARQ